MEQRILLAVHLGSESCPSTAPRPPKKTSPLSLRGYLPSILSLPLFQTTAPAVPWSPGSPRTPEAEDWLADPRQPGLEAHRPGPTCGDSGRGTTALPASTRCAGQASYPHPTWGF